MGKFGWSISRWVCQTLCSVMALVCFVSHNASVPPVTKNEKYQSLLLMRKRLFSCSLCFLCIEPSYRLVKICRVKLGSQYTVGCSVSFRRRFRREPFCRLVSLRCSQYTLTLYLRTLAKKNTEVKMIWSVRRWALTLEQNSALIQGFVSSLTFVVTPHNVHKLPKLTLAHSIILPHCKTCNASLSG